MWINLKDMEHVFFLCFFGSVLVLFGADGQSTGQINIPSCTEGLLDIRENENNTIVCNAFGANTTIAWFIKQRSEEKQEIATCGPSNCTVYLPTYFAVLRFPEQSHLFYQQHNVTEDTSTQLSCDTQQEYPERSFPCIFNVINPATLSDCVVEEDRRNGTVKGRCHFRNALSERRGLTCKWYQENTEQSRTSYNGAITVTSTTDGGHGEGQCTLSTKGHTWDNAPYSYSIDFYPGNGLHAVHTVKQDVTSATMTAITVFEETTSVPDGEGQVTSIAVIVGGCAGGGGVTVVVVVIVVIVIKRRDGTYAKPRRRRNVTDVHVYAVFHNNATTTATAPPSGSTETTINDQHNDSHNEHHNHVYVNDTESGSPNAPDYYNQVIMVNSALQQNPTYENDLSETNHGYSNGDRDSSPYYSEIKNIESK